MPFWLLDVIIVAVLLVILIVGYIIGFLRTMIKIISSLGGLVIALLLTEPVTNGAINLGLDDGLSNKIMANIQATDAYIQCANPETEKEGFKNLLIELGVPDFLSELFSSSLADSVNVEEAARTISDGISRVATTVIVFILLLIFSAIGFAIIKAVVTKLRDSVLAVKVIDGIFGAALFGVFGVLLVCIFMLIASLIMQSNTNGFTEFMHVSLHLDDDNFGIAKYFYQHNVLGNFIALIM